MAMVVNHNISAINTLRNLNTSNLMMSKSLQKLSSGFRINVGADGPADLIISEQLRAQTVGLQRAVRNTQEASNVIGIAEGALNEMNNILKTMRELALHAANSGITSPEQVAADQAEVDSSIQTIDRIANTTKYSDQFLLNGSQSLLWDTNVVKGNSIIDKSFTRMDQVFKLSGVKEAFNYTGLNSAGDTAKMTTQATKGFMESGATSGSLNDLDLDQNQLAADQRFVVSGSKGSREFSFASGYDLNSIAAAINNVSGSTGVAANMVVAGQGFTLRTHNVTDIDYDTALAEGDGNTVSAGQTLVFGQSDLTNDGIQAIAWLNEPVLGKATDGQGRIYVEYSGGANVTVNLYKGPKQADGTFDEDDLVASGSFDNTAADGLRTGISISERNDSGISATMSILGVASTAMTDSDVVIATQTFDRVTTDRAAQLFLAGGTATSGVTVVADTAGFGGNDISIEIIDPKAASQTGSSSLDGNKITVILDTNANGDIITDADGLRDYINAAAPALVTATSVGGAGYVEARGVNFLSGGLDANQGINIDGDTDGPDTIAISGLELGVNTDSEGKLYFTAEDADSDGDADNLYVYKDSSRSADSLVASFTGNVEFADNNEVVLNQENDSGLRMVLEITTATQLNPGDSTWTMQQGIRLSSTEYGDSSFVKVQAFEGKMWDYYDPTNADADADTGYVNVDATSGSITAESRGTGAIISVNGKDVFTDGLTAEASTADFNGHLAFLEGIVGKTTIAQVGYLASYGSTGIGQMMKASNVHVNAGVNNREDAENFSNGMQFQLGEGSGDQERTVYSIQSMAVANLGRVSFYDDFDGTGTYSTKELSLQDILGGGYASLAVDPVKSLDIIDAAINDVSSLRARLGSTQKNLLQTNANSLNVAIENITATESSIRDADMAGETTDFTKNQILVQAGTAMLAQANVVSQNVLQLLG